MINGGWFQKIKGCSAFRAGHTLMFFGYAFLRGMCGRAAGYRRGNRTGSKSGRDNKY